MSGNQVASPMTPDDAFHDEAARVIGEVRNQFKDDLQKCLGALRHQDTLQGFQQLTAAASLYVETIHGLELAIDRALGNSPEPTKPWEEDA